MHAVTIRFYEELNDLLPKPLRKRDFPAVFPGRRSVKDLVESFGVPHTEVDVILVNGESVDFSHSVGDGDRISVYPVFETLAIKNVTRLRPEPLRSPRFACDRHLGKLARRLRLLGFDTSYARDAAKDALRTCAVEEGRVLLTRDRQLLKHKDIRHGILIRGTDPERQVREVLDRLDLRGECKPFGRCTLCNGVLIHVRAGTENFAIVQQRVPPRVRDRCNAYTLCPCCEKVYWEGGHHAKLRQKVREYLEG